MSGTPHQQRKKELPNEAKMSLSPPLKHLGNAKSAFGMPPANPPTNLLRPRNQNSILQSKNAVHGAKNDLFRKANLNTPLSPIRFEISESSDQDSSPSATGKSPSRTTSFSVKNKTGAFSNMFSRIKQRSGTHVDGMDSKSDSRKIDDDHSFAGVSELWQEYEQDKMMKGFNSDHCHKWSNKLAYSVDSVYKQLGVGSAMAYRISKILRKYVAIQKSFSEELISMVDHERTKVIAMENPDLLQSQWVLVLGLLNNMKNIGTAHKEHALAVEANSVRNMELFDIDSDKRIKDLNARKKIAYDEIQTAKANLTKNRRLCLKLIAAMEADGDDNRMGEFKKFMAAATENTFKFSSKDPTERAYQACVHYENALQTSRAIVANVVDNKMSVMLDDLQEAEEFRHFVTEKSIREFNEYLKPVQMSYSNVINEFTNTLQGVDRAADIDNFIKQCTLFADFANYDLKYDLPINVKDLQNQITDPVLKQKLGIGRFINVSLSATMASQKKQYPKLMLPLTFLKLRQVLESMGGYSQEGIFRLAASQQELEEYIENVKEGNFSCKFLDPAVPANALKQWLRELDAPLIEYRHYQRCIELGKKSGSLTFAKSCNQLISSLPEANRALIHSLTMMSREISNKVNLSSSRMSINNLAIIFAPAILRSPDDSQATPDVLEIAAKSANEIAFVQSLFETLEVDKSLLHLDFWE